MIRQQKLGVIDIGTNSCHLVVAGISRQGVITVLDTDKVSLQLGRHVDEHGYLSVEAIENTKAAVSRMKEICKGHRANIKAVATHAVRNAKNQHTLIQEVKDTCGILIEPIDGLEEARLIFLGMRFGLSLDDRQYLGVDIGGGSTEIIAGTNQVINYAASLKLGAVTLSVRFLSAEPTSQKVEELKEFIATGLEAQVSSQLPFTTAIVSSGTGKALAGIDYFLRTGKDLKDPNGYILPHENLLEIVAKIEELRSPAEIEQAFGLEKSRAEIILAGSLILQKISQWYQVKQWKISTCCLREGIVIDACDTYTNLHNTRWQSILALGDKFRVDQRHAKRVLHFTLNLLQAFPESLLPKVNFEQMQELLSAATYLHEVGRIIDYDRYHKHSHYIILHSSLLGFNRREKEIIAHIIRHQRKKIPVYRDHLSSQDNAVIRLLAAILRIGVAGFRRRRNRLPGVKISEDDVLTFIFYYMDKNFPEIEMFNLRSEQKAVEESLGLDVSFVMQKRELN